MGVLTCLLTAKDTYVVFFVKSLCHFNKNTTIEWFIEIYIYIYRYFVGELSIGEFKVKIKFKNGTSTFRRTM